MRIDSGKSIVPQGAGAAKAEHSKEARGAAKKDGALAAESGASFVNQVDAKKAHRRQYSRGSDTEQQASHRKSAQNFQSEPGTGKEQFSAAQPLDAEPGQHSYSQAFNDQADYFTHRVHRVGLMPRQVHAALTTYAENQGLLPPERQTKSAVAGIDIRA